MSEAYERVKGGRLTFKGGAVASRSKSIDKPKKKTKKHKKKLTTDADFTEEILTGDAATAVTEDGGGGSTAAEGGGGDEAGIYTIDAAKKMKYDELFPVEAKKFRYDPNAKVKSVADALDDRVKKKADRYCK
ncbi:hypothetical protein CTI12_AA587060 [Artemisia annua]|uniref:Uncharacterized protein n=1 Tax=Artemisia annua TaxID=35608 RepID=A0A2U1KLU8_ARTAN|nr:hypothetical protein CTI12_AA587060 [Artemisia annua]